MFFFFVFRPYMSCEEKDGTYGGVLYWASSFADINDDKI